MTRAPSGDGDTAPELERAYRRLMVAFPRDYRSLREEEMVAVLLAASDGSRRRPSAGETLDLVLAGVRVRLHRLANPVTVAGFVVAALLLLCAAGLADTAVRLRGAQVDAGTATAEPGLARRMPGWDPVPADASAHPAGAAIAAFMSGHEDATPFELLVSAHRPTARRASGRLSPDGRWLATVGTAVELLDLTTGSREILPRVRTDPADTIAAWSSDGTLVAVLHSSTLTQVDRRSGTAEDLGPARSAAYALGDDRLALSRTGVVTVRDGDGAGVVQFPVRSDDVIAAAGWSPDGRRIALAGPRGIAVLDVDDGRVRAVPSLGTSVTALAWHDDTVLLVRDDTYGAPLRSVDVMTGVDHELVRFPASDPAYSLQLAQALTPHAALVDVAAFDRGPMPIRPDRVVAFVAVLLAATVITRFGAMTSSSDATARQRAWRFVWSTIAICVLTVCAAGPAVLLHALTSGSDEVFLDVAAACALLAAVVATRALVWASRNHAHHLSR